MERFLDEACLCKLTVVHTICAWFLCTTLQSEDEDFEFNEHDEFKIPDINEFV